MATKTQIATLKTIHENPGKAVAWLRFSQLKSSMVMINGNTERALEAAGLIREVGTGRTIDSVVPGRANSTEITVWELTDEGRKVIGVEVVEEAPAVEISPEATAAIAGFVGIQTRTDATRIAQDMRTKTATARKTGTVRATKSAELFEEIAIGMDNLFR